MIKIYLTGLLQGMNHGYIITNPNQSMLQCNENGPIHLQPKKFKVMPSAGKVMLTMFGILREYC
jgi:hypothetical protein